MQNERSLPLSSLRVGAIDIGSNALRLSVAELVDPERAVELASIREPVRLGEDAFHSGELSARTMERAVDAMSSFRRRLDALEVEAVRVVATSAVRDSRNGDDLVARTRAKSGLEIEIIDGAEEARLVEVAVRSRMPLDGRWLLVDLGGGSLEVSVSGARGIAASESLPLGTLRLLADSGPAPDEVPGRVDALLDDAFPRLGLGDGGSAGGNSGRGGPAGVAGLIATGGNIEALARLAGVTPNANGVSRLPLPALRRTRARLEAMSYDERVEELMLRPDRADVIIPAGTIYLRVAERAGVEEIVVPHVGVKEGVLLELIAAHSPASAGLVTLTSHSDDEETDGGEGGESGSSEPDGGGGGHRGR